MDTLQKARQAIQILLDNGARDAFIVGGFVRDSLLGIEDSKDIDIEVFGLTHDEIIKILWDGRYFSRVKSQGTAFGVISVDNEIDISIPRREKKVGEGHTGFEVEFDPDMSFEEAAARRDLTINSMAMRLDGEILDPFNGAEDFRNRWLRHTSDAFVEDPLRVLRVMQFAGRFAFRLHPSTVPLCIQLRSEFNSLSIERIWGEWKKWALRSIKPSAGLQALVDAGWIHFFPEINHIQGVLQDEEWHPEGDVFIHTQHVVDAAARIADREKLEADDRIVLMFAALAHDFGKATCWQWENGRIRAKGHEGVGADMVERFMDRIGAPKRFAPQIKPLVDEHLAYASNPDPNPRAVRRLALRLQPSNIRIWSMLVEANHSGRPPLPPSNPAKHWEELAANLSVQENEPEAILMG